MGSHKNVIEINGKLYDATSGTLITNHTISPAAKPVKSVDGFRPSTIKPSVVTPAVQQPTGLRPKPLTHRTPPSQLKHRTPQKSHTLMRTAVKKPAAQKPTEINSLAKKATLENRSEKAKIIQKSAYINKFGTLSHHQPIVKRTEPLKVKEAPQHHHTAPRPVVKTTAVHTPHVPPAPVSKSEELFNKALQNATPTKATKKRAKKSGSSGRITKWGTSIAAALLLIGFITYMNLPNLNMQLASARAGFAASMPGYTPSGFKNGAVDYKAGQVTVSFASNTDQRNYTVTQAVSSWNSEALQENFLNARNKNFQTAQESGKTIYMYDGGNATWVNGGVWYQVESNKALSSDQLLKIASSL